MFVILNQKYKKMYIVALFLDGRKSNITIMKFALFPLVLQ